MERTATPGIYKRGSRYVVVDRDRRGRQFKRFARTLAEARDLKRKARPTRQPQRVTFAAYANEWLTSYQGRSERGLSANTLADYKRSLEQDAIPFLGQRRLDEITPGEIKRYGAELGKRLAPSSVKKALTVVRIMLATAVEDEDYGLPSNPALGIRTSGRQEDDASDRVKALDEDELRRLSAELPSEWRLFFDFLFQTGCGSARRSRSVGAMSTSVSAG
jgi:integrase